MNLLKGTHASLAQPRAFLVLIFDPLLTFKHEPSITKNTHLVDESLESENNNTVYFKFKLYRQRK